MTLMASPNAYLALEQPTVTGATEAGTGTVDGVPVTNYDGRDRPARARALRGAVRGRDHHHP